MKTLKLIIFAFLAVFALNGQAKTVEEAANTAYTPFGASTKPDCQPKIGLAFLRLNTSIKLPAFGECKKLQEMHALRSVANQQMAIANVVGAVNAHRYADATMRSLYNTKHALWAYKPTEQIKTERVQVGVNVVMAVTETVNEHVGDKELTFTSRKFNTDKTNLSADGKAELNAYVAKFIDGDYSITVAGHADQRGNANYNLGLSERRAEEVKTLLVGFGLDGDKINTVGYGETQLLSNENNPTAWNLNRRVEITVTVPVYEERVRVVSPEIITPVYEEQVVVVKTATQVKAMHDIKVANWYVDDAILQGNSEKLSTAIAVKEFTLHKQKAVEGDELSEIDLETAVIWANALDSAGVNVEATKLAKKFWLEYEDGEYVAPGTYGEFG